MRRPQRTIKRESTVRIRSKGAMRQLVLHVPPNCDVLLIREKGRRSGFELDILTAYHVAARLAAAKRRAH